MSKHMVSPCVLDRKPCGNYCITNLFYIVEEPLFFLFSMKKNPIKDTIAKAEKQAEAISRDA